MNRSAMLNIYWKLQKQIVPDLEYSQTIYEEVLSDFVNTESIWLDLGCGHQILPPWRVEREKILVGRCKKIVGIDYDINSLKGHKGISLKLRTDIKRLPFKENSFSLVTSNMVVEHLDAPVEQFKEIQRVLKPDGFFLFHTPNSISLSVIMARLIPITLKNKVIKLLEGRKETDIFPTYYRVNTPKKIQQIARLTGFNYKIKMIVSHAQFAVIPPLAIIELLLIRILMKRPFKMFRSNIIGILQKAKG